MRVAVLGTGALACLYASLLNEVAEVHLFGRWEAQKQVIRAQGLRVLDTHGAERVEHLKVSELIDFPNYFDLVMVLVKNYQTEQAAKDAKWLIKDNPEACVICLQNGLGQKQLLESYLPNHLIFEGVSYQAALIREPGLLFHTGVGDTVLPHALSKEIKNIFEVAELPTQYVEDTDSAIWTKLIVNAAINPLTALLKVENGYLLKEAYLVKLLKGLATEAASVAKAYGVKLLVKSVSDEVIRVVEYTAANRSSMLRDMEEGRPTEIESITGQLIRLGEEKGIHLPLSLTIYRMVLAASHGKATEISELKRLV